MHPKTKGRMKKLSFFHTPFICFSKFRFSNHEKLLNAKQGFALTTKKHLSTEVLNSRATRIRTLNWRSQSPLPYRLAIALCVRFSLALSLATNGIIYQVFINCNPFFQFFSKNFLPLQIALRIVLFKLLYMFYFMCFYLINRLFKRTFPFSHCNMF